MLEVDGHAKPNPDAFGGDLRDVERFKVGPILEHREQLAFLGQVEAIVGHVENAGHVCVRAGGWVKRGDINLGLLLSLFFLWVS